MTNSDYTWTIQSNVPNKEIAMTTADTTTIHELTPKEGRELLDQEARRCLGISGEEFVRRWKAHEFEGPEDTNVIRVAMLLPFAGEELS